MQELRIKSTAVKKIERSLSDAVAPIWIHHGSTFLQR